MSRLRHTKGLPKMAGALSGVHRLAVAKPHPFKPIEERKHGGETHDVHGKAHHHKLGRKRGGSVKKKRDDGGNVTTVAKTKPGADYDRSSDLGQSIGKLKSTLSEYDQYRKAKSSPAEPDEHHVWSPERGQPGGRAHGGHVGHGHHGTDATPDRGMKFGTHVQGTPMAGTESGYGGKFAHGKGHVEDSLKDGGKVKWLQGAIKHPGALHKQLHVPAGEKIPEKKLEKASHSSNPTLRRRANLAKTMKGFKH